MIHSIIHAHINTIDNATVITKNTMDNTSPAATVTKNNYYMADKTPIIIVSISKCCMYKHSYCMYVGTIHTVAYIMYLYVAVMIRFIP